MGEIQSNINSVINTAALGFGLYANTPMGQRMGELRQLKLRERGINRQYNALMQKVSERPGANIPMESAESQVYDKIVTQGREVAQRRFEINPTAKNLQRYQNSLLTGKTSQEWAAEQAQASMEAAQIQRQAQRDLMSEFKSMNTQERATFLKESQHFQAQSKRGN